jgi:hypothetical protein
MGFESFDYVYLAFGAIGLFAVVLAWTNWYANKS